MTTQGCSCMPERSAAHDAAAAVEAVAARLRPHVRRPEAHQHAVDYLRGLLADVERKNGWQLTEYAGYAHPRTEAPDRRREAGVPEGLSSRTKPELALEMVERALDAGVPAAWVVGDEVYGSDGKLRRALEERGQAYVLAVRSNEATTTWPPYGLPGQLRVVDLVASLPDEGWQELSCGEGAQGPRLYDWAFLRLRPALRDGWGHGLLLRRHPDRAEEIAYYLVYAPSDTLLSEMVRAAGARWTIADLFKLAKGQVGLDHYEVRSWHGWHRHITLALLALAALAIGARKKGGLRALSTYRSPSRRSAGCSSGSSGPPPIRLSRWSSGPAGAVTTRGLPRSAIAVAA